MADDNHGMSPLHEAAIGLHEMYTELRSVGFSRSEALELVSKVVTGGFSEAMRNMQEDEDGSN